MPRYAPCPELLTCDCGICCHVQAALANFRAPKVCPCSEPCLKGGRLPFQWQGAELLQVSQQALDCHEPSL